ncbi:MULTISPECIES: TetR/AcrR family transcriptional regulator [unclassified Pseudoclavibacter]|uniref:TetR/AcrR family transcriptional regulator n=1 Tax=unclassified Pseudoclavibacter TaxID=2615177 RepID=UPI001C635090|nr:MULTISPECIES: TetR/AcrR family transcriptional regulator [unclassified Pseudoclavibacter]
MAGRTRAQMIDVTRASLIAAARTAFARDGYAATSMDALTAAAGLTRGALYHHFGGKEGLLRAVVSGIDGEIDAELLAISDAEPRAGDALRKRSRAYITRTSAPEVQQILFHDAPAVLREGGDVASRSCVDSIAKIIESGQATGEISAGASPRSLAIALHGALSDLSRWSSEGDTAHGEGRLEEALAASDVLVVALSPRS